MRIVIGYPPIEQDKGTPLLSQNRQFQYFNAPTYIYPMVPAYAATIAKEAGHEVYWMDGIAERQTYVEWKKDLKEIDPDYLMIETKSPVVKDHWKIVDELKKEFKHLKIIMVGDHITFKPEETLDNCKVDYLLLGGDYDFLLTEVIEAIRDKKELPAGVWGRKEDKDVVLPEGAIKKGKYWTTGLARLTHNLDELPFVDRDLTKWELYAYENGNYKYTPATYMYSGRDCW